MRALALLALVAGCGFHIGSGAPSDGATVDSVVGDVNTQDDALVDAPTDVSINPSNCLTPKVWEADFSTDPRTLDVNGDTTFDWGIRSAAGAAQLPGTLSGGIWTVPAPPIVSLDTQPKQNFATRTKITLRMRHVGTSTNDDQFGAVFWINVGYGDTDFAPIYLALTHIGATQQLVLYTKDGTQAPIELDRRDNLTTAMQEILLIVDPGTHLVSLTAGIATTVHTFTEIPANANDDRWASLVAWSSSVEFDRVRVEVCP
jgi:hypothetical protein